MTKRKNATKKSFWERVETPIGVIGGVLGLVVVALDMPGKVSEALGESDEKERLELEHKRAEVAAAGPRLEASYAFLNEDLVGIADFATKRRPKAADTILSFPVMRNEVMREVGKRGGRHRGCALDEFPQYSVAFLVIRNRGHRNAADISVRVKHLRLSAAVPIRETLGGGDDYLAKLHGRTRASNAVTVQIPLTLEPGEGVRVPLWRTVSPDEGAEDWCVVSPTALEPRSLRFVDPVTGSATTTAVRRLADPVMLANGIVGRG